LPGSHTLADVIVGVAQLFSLGHEILLRFFVSQIGRRRFSAVRFFGEFGSNILDGARLALICRRRASAAASGERQRFLSDVFMKIHETWFSFTFVVRQTG
jgi:hypothetical protein